MIFKTHNRPFLTIAAIFVATMCFGAELTHAQGISYMQSMFSRKPAPKSEVKPAASTDNLGPSVQEIHRLATQMAWQVGWEISRDKDSGTELSTVHAELRKHSSLTANLVKTYQGDSAKSFQSAAVDVRKSVGKLKQLCEKTELNTKVVQMLKRSEPIATFLSEHRGSFNP